MTQQLGSSPVSGPGKPMVRFTGIAPVNGLLLVYLMALVELLLVFMLPETVSLNNCKEVLPLMLVAGIKNMPDCSILATPSLQAEGVAL